MFMEKKGNPTVHGIVANNVIPFTSRQTISDAEKYAEATFKQKKEENGTFLEKEVDVLVCSLCESNKFFLVNDDKRTVGCSNCGYLTSTHWIIPDGF
tara:strand:+ start:2556 stop:2846 length:291 start_codon:yes stop_codon:yes gene_type:complete